MDTRFWDLFWTTGMPEAWLMSRGREAEARPGPEPGSGQGAPGPLVGFTYPLAGNVPGSPGNLY